MADNLFEQLKDVLQEFKDFLDANVATIKPAINSLAEMIPQIGELLDLLISLLDKLKTEIENLDVSNIPGLAEVSSFSTQITSFLEAARNLLPDERQTIEEILEVAEVVTGLPSLEEVKAEILSLIAAIRAHLVSLKPA
jgi:ABC-type transporter Mla subunit MlaD